MKIGLLFGSFNPVHIGHLYIAQSLVAFTDVESTWLVVSPQNPFKTAEKLLPAETRLEMVNRAVADNPSLQSSDVELSLPQPSYTIQTLKHLTVQFPEHEFVLALGTDNLPDFHRWKDARKILHDFQLYIYKRKGFAIPDHFLHQAKKGTHVPEAPVLEISSTFIRHCISKNLPVRYLVHDEVLRYIETHGLYRQ